MAQSMDTATSIAEIVDWRYEYRFTADDHVDIDIHVTLRKADDTPIVAAASLFAAGDTTPAGLVAAGPGVYDVLLPIRDFRCIPWMPHSQVGGTQRRYLLNVKLTAVPEGEWDEPEVFAFEGATVGFRSLSPDLELNAVGWSPQEDDSDDAKLRSRLTQARAEGFNLIVAIANQTDSFYSLCDELGLLATQMASGDETASVESRRLRRHPSIAFWSEPGAPLTDYMALADEPGPPFSIAARVPVHTI